MTGHGLDAASAGLPPTLCGGLSARPSGVWGTMTCRSRAAADTAGCLHVPSLRSPENRHSCPFSWFSSSGGDGRLGASVSWDTAQYHRDPWPPGARGVDEDEALGVGPQGSAVRWAGVGLGCLEPVRAQRMLGLLGVCRAGWLVRTRARARVAERRKCLSIRRQPSVQAAKTRVDPYSLILDQNLQPGPLPCTASWGLLGPQPVSGRERWLSSGPRTKQGRAVSPRPSGWGGVRACACVPLTPSSAVFPAGTPLVDTEAWGFSDAQPRTLRPKPSRGQVMSWWWSPASHGVCCPWGLWGRRRRQHPGVSPREKLRWAHGARVAWCPELWAGAPSGRLPAGTSPMSGGCTPP